MTCRGGVTPRIVHNPSRCRARGGPVDSRPDEGHRRRPPALMPLLKPLTREEIAPELRALWNECEAAYPDFRNSWATMAHSPILFRHVWGQLLALKKESPVEARHFELAILIVSNTTRCEYCVAHHKPRALGTGLSAAQTTALASLARAPLAEDHDFAGYPG